MTVKKTTTTQMDRQREDRIRLISRLLDRASTAQLREIYLLLCGYLEINQD